MLQKPSPDQLKIGIGLAFALFLVNGQNNSTVTRTQRTVASNTTTPIALAASTATVSSPAVAGGCATAQRQVQIPADAVLNLRSYANGPILNTLAPGTTVTVQRNDGAWLEVITASGQSGWAFSQYLGCR